MDLFVTLTRVDFLNELNRDVKERNDTVVTALVETFLAKSSVDFTTNLDNGARGFRINASSTNNAKNVRIIARDIEKQQHPTVHDFRVNALNAALHNAVAQTGGGGSKSYYFSVPPSEIFKGTLPKEGLIIVFGTTGSGKSVLADDIARHLYLPILSDPDAGSMPGGHLLRYGDPVEGPIDLWTSAGYRNGNLKAYPLSTVRNRPHDVEDIRQFGTDALRQKPKIVTLAELRDDIDLASAIELASTGHLVIATAHAGSLKDGFLRLMKAYRCFEFPELRTPLVKALFAVIHVEAQEEKLVINKGAANQDTIRTTLTLPTVWRRENETEQHFITDGVAHMNPSSEPNSSCCTPWAFYGTRATRELSASVAVISRWYEEARTANQKSRFGGVALGQVADPNAYSRLFDSAIDRMLKPWRKCVEASVLPPTLEEILVHRKVKRYLLSKVIFEHEESTNVDSKMSLKRPMHKTKKIDEAYQIAKDEARMLLQMRLVAEMNKVQR